MQPYLIRSSRDAVRYFASNLLTKQYFFYTSFYIPPEKDEILVDAKLLVRYGAFRSKEQEYRRRRAGLSTVRYFRVGRIAFLFATKGKSEEFFQQEQWFDIRERPLCLSGYSIRVDKASGKVSVRIHRETQRRIRREWIELAKDDVKSWEQRIWDLEFLPFAGVRDGLFALIRDLNASRKLLRKPPIRWQACVRKRIKPEPVFEASPSEIIELLEHHRRLK